LNLLLNLGQQSLSSIFTQVELIAKSFNDFSGVIVFKDLYLFHVFSVQLYFQDADRFFNYWQITSEVSATQSAWTWQVLVISTVKQLLQCFYILLRLLGRTSLGVTCLRMEGALFELLLEGNLVRVSVLAVQLGVVAFHRSLFEGLVGLLDDLLRFRINLGRELEGLLLLLLVELLQFFLVLAVLLSVTIHEFAASTRLPLLPYNTSVNLIADFVNLR
jgi:hypothetical protein